MEPTKTATLKVPGATLYYEVRGAGPVLLMICGGIYDAAAPAELAQRLADRHTVVTYDRRGNSRSPLDEPPGPQRVEVHADDAHRLLTAVAGLRPRTSLATAAAARSAWSWSPGTPSRSGSWLPMSRRSSSSSPTGRTGGTSSRRSAAPTTPKASGRRWTGSPRPWAQTPANRAPRKRPRQNHRRRLPPR
jgi:hypothetical protein